MNEQNPSARPKRTVTAPLPDGPAGQFPPNRVLSVLAEEDEEVEWTWSISPAGHRYVSGYTIHRKPHPTGG